MNCPFGIQNTGNTCYFNSLLQLVLSSKHIYNNILKTVGHDDIHHLNNNTDQGNVYLSKWMTKHLIIGLDSKQSSDIDHPVLKNIHFLIEKAFVTEEYGVFGTPDCSDMGLLLLINNWELSDLVTHKICKSVVCNLCGVIESMNEVKVKIEDYSNSTSIVDQLENYIDTPSGYKCEKCGLIDNVFIKYDVRHLPPVIFITYNCFSYTNIDQSFYVNHDKYELKGAVLYNNSHYWFLGKRGNHWYVINDAHVEMMTGDLYNLLKFSRIVIYELD